MSTATNGPSRWRGLLLPAFISSGADPAALPADMGREHAGAQS